MSELTISYDHPHSIAETKAQLRQSMRVRLHDMNSDRRAVVSAEMRLTLMRQPVWERARNVMMFVPLITEPDIFPLLQTALDEGKKVCLPRFDHEKQEYEVFQIADPVHDLIPGYYNILEPVAACPLFPRIQLDFVLVPGVAFDEAGHRLGRGKGYYDRLLKPVNGIKCGVAFEEQMVQEVPIEPHDLKLNCILTPVRWVFADGAPVR